ncbi:hypothetical protein [Nitrospirillum iridis]|uniref:TolB-like protein/Tfp pilus assembly protein PilF n=1 Tax=Nitrospirillum iridis TaxID=765888 RepID=A0A7X0AXM8_9PROT|nr:hypothetical protein [Nitrospirillum iridis]MBB6252018.1 TolB-like protein/Tfp pilus assembly protein PilF [Nitrospirillum iridis]
MASASTPSPWAVREQVDRLGASPRFAGSERLLAFLHFIVEETLAGRGATLKEAVIGNAVYGREPPYDPRIDSTVRVEARRLRRKLEDHYAGPGRQDPVIITLPTGGYVPLFTPAPIPTEPAEPDAEAGDGALFTQGFGAAVAVMPFRALNRDGDDESFADGLTDELIYALGRAQGMRVTSRSVAFQYKDRGWPVPTLARELGVDVVLQGTVRRQDGLLRVTVELSDPQGFVLWSDRIDAPDHERLRLQERIAATVLSRARLDNSGVRASRLSPGPVALEAHARIYRARQLMGQQTPRALREAQELFQRVASAAPDYARGHSGIADCQCDLFRLGMVDHATAEAVAKPAVRRALEIDPQSVEAHTSRATIAAWLDRDAVAAEADFGHALRLGGHARAARLYGVFLTIFERHEEAERLFREARAIEPFSAQQDIAEATCHYQARRFALLTGQLDAAGDDAMPAEVLVYRALSHVFAREPDAARALVGPVERATGTHRDLAYARAEIEAWLGAPERGWRLLATADAIPATAFARATLAAALNDEASGLAALERAIDRRELSTVWLPTDPRFDAWRGRPGFQALLDRLRPSRAPASTDAQAG